MTGGVNVWSNRMLYTSPVFRILEIVNEFDKHSRLPVLPHNVEFITVIERLKPYSGFMI